MAKIPGFSLVLILLASYGCAKNQALEPKPESGSAATPESHPPEAASVPTAEPSAGGETCGDVACTSSSECCKGYACGFDPERSKVQRYCLAQ